jgi:hypothetical protein
VCIICVYRVNIEIFIYYIELQKYLLNIVHKYLYNTNIYLEFWVGFDNIHTLFIIHYIR